MGRRLRRILTAPLLPALILCNALAQTTPTAPPAADTRPLPDIPTLMHQVESNQRNDETRLRNYIFRQTLVLTPTDGNGNPKKEEVRVSDVFWIDGVPVSKLISKDGRPLSPDDLKKEDERIDKEVAKAKERRAKNDSKGEQTDPNGNEEITVSRMLELGTFTNPRRVTLNGRTTIAVDYIGDPHTKTRNRAEGFFHDLVGTVWIDEGDHELARLECHTTRSFKVGAGLIADIREGTSLVLEQAKINNDVWLPTSIDANGAARILLLFSFDGSAHIRDSDFRRFHTSATLLPGVGKVTDDAPTTPLPTPPAPQR